MISILPLFYKLCQLRCKHSTNFIIVSLMISSAFTFLARFLNGFIPFWKTFFVNMNIRDGSKSWPSELNLGVNSVIQMFCHKGHHIPIAHHRVFVFSFYLLININSDIYDINLMYYFFHSDFKIILTTFEMNCHE
ncbi:hypothetical protein ACTFIW_000224 [Dictyostelium discoideum]